MNKRIEHIIKQVDEYFDDLSIEFSRQAWMDKFALLIVEECMQHVQWVGKTNKNPVEPIHTAHAVNQRIKQKFGVDR